MLSVPIPEALAVPEAFGEGTWWRKTVVCNNHPSPFVSIMKMYFHYIMLVHTHNITSRSFPVLLVETTYPPNHWRAKTCGQRPRKQRGPSERRCSGFGGNMASLAAEPERHSMKKPFLYRHLAIFSKSHSSHGPCSAPLISGRGHPRVIPRQGT